jgi:hypothetical protein
MEFSFLKNTAQDGQSFFFLPFFLQFFIYQKWCSFLFFQFNFFLKSCESWLKKTQFFSENTTFASLSTIFFLEIAEMHPKEQKKGY